MGSIHAAVMLLLVGQVAEGDSVRALFDFAAPGAAQRWQAVNDGVMGGVSDGRFRLTPEGTLEFSGVLSLENNGGFASVRTKPAGLGLRPGDSLVVRVKGDGREYMLNAYTKNARMAFSWRAPVPTIDGEWTEVTIPLTELVPTSFGRVLEGQGPVNPADINALGFMLSDKKPGKFRLEIESVGALPGESAR